MLASVVKPTLFLSRFAAGKTYELPPAAEGVTAMVSEKSLGLRGRLARLAVRCPECRQVWLAPGLSGGDKHACKACGAVFVKKVSVSPQPSRDLLCPLPQQGAG